MLSRLLESAESKFGLFRMPVHADCLHLCLCITGQVVFEASVPPPLLAARVGCKPGLGILGYGGLQAKHAWYWAWFLGYDSNIYPLIQNDVAYFH